MSEARVSGVERVVPYAIVFCGAAFLVYRAQHFEFTATEDQIGPDSWPKLILYMIMATSAFEGARRLLLAWNGDLMRLLAPAMTESLTMEREPADIRIVFSCVAASIIYLALFETVGFFIDTLAFIFALVWIGRFRSFWIATAVSGTATIVFMLIFMRVIFVALPIGEGPFQTISLAVMRLIGVH